MKKKHVMFFVVFIVFSVFTAVANPVSGNKSRSQELYKNNDMRYMKSNHVNEVYDPIEPINRFMFGVHIGVDHLLLKPLGQVYNTVVPSVGRNIIRDFFANLAMFVTIPNQFLQGNPDLAFESMGRLLVNTTIGVGGMFDIASELGMHHHKEDFGNTLAVYDIPHGPYLFIPVLGPSSVRNLTGKVIDNQYIDVVNRGLSKSKRSLRIAAEGVSKRASNIDFIDNIRRISDDPYSHMRILYFHDRDSKVIESKTK